MLEEWAPIGSIKRKKTRIRKAVTKSNKQLIRPGKMSQGFHYDTELPQPAAFKKILATEALFKNLYITKGAI